LQFAGSNPVGRRVQIPLHWSQPLIKSQETTVAKRTIEVDEDGFAVIEIESNAWLIEGTYEECRDFVNYQKEPGVEVVIVVTIHSTEGTSAEEFCDGGPPPQTI
jgi:hypothetical protein